MNLQYLMDENVAPVYIDQLKRYDFYLAQRRKDAKNQRKEWLFYTLIQQRPIF